MFALVSVLSVTMNGTLVMITCVCKPVHIITNTNRISNWLIGMWAEKKKKHIAITSYPHSCPKNVMWLCRSPSQAQSVLAVKEQQGENSVSSEGHVTVSDVLLCGGVVLPTLSLTSSPPSSRPRPSPSLHITRWPETTGPKNLTSSSVFLMNPIFCLRAQGVHIHPSRL